MRKSFKKIFAVLFCVGMVLVGSAGATIWNPTDEFSIDNGNPNGVWSYGYMQYSSNEGVTVFGNLTLLPYCTTNDYGRFWGMEGGDIPSIWMNDTSDVVEGVEAGQLALHPGWENKAVTLRWTAPTDITSKISIVGEFFEGNIGEMLVGVLVNGSLVWSGVDCGTFDLTASVSAGDTVDFVVYADYIAFGATPIEVNITTIIPEPTTIALLGLGGLLLRKRYGYRKLKS